MTAEVKDELSRLVVNSVSARRAEVAALLHAEVCGYMGNKRMA